MVSTEFSLWLKKQMEDRGMNQAQLARRSKTTTATISRVLNGTRNAGPEICASIADAFGLSPDVVYRAAGLLPEKRGDDNVANEIIDIYKMLNDYNRLELLEYARHRLSKQERESGKRYKYASIAYIDKKQCQILDTVFFCFFMACITHATYFTRITSNCVYCLCCSG